jgi:hypothetical protein
MVPWSDTVADQLVKGRLNPEKVRSRVGLRDTTIMWGSACSDRGQRVGSG